jgi:membrane associated rhomboid family serine protease
MHPLRDLGRYGTVGLDLLISMALGYYGGRWLDARVGAQGWVTGAGALLGVIVGFYSLWKASRTMQRDLERADEKGKATERDKRWT